MKKNKKLKKQNNYLNYNNIKKKIDCNVKNRNLNQLNNKSKRPFKLYQVIRQIMNNDYILNALNKK